MSLFPRRRRSGAGRTDAAALEEQNAALREALDSCRTFARRSKRASVLAVSALVVTLGIAVLVDREAMRATVDGVISRLGGAESGGADAAYAAYKAGDAEAALRLARPLAEQGNARAQTLVGLIHQAGRGVAQDESEAMNWFRRAAGQGDNTAQFQLGMMYFTGRGVPQNYPEAAKWYRLAAEGGHPQAQFNLGAMYYNGQGVPQSNVHAHAWFNLAAARFSASELRNRESAVKVRDVMAMKMSREELAEAQRLARDWKGR